MDPLRIVARAAFAFVVLLLLVRMSGKRTAMQGTPFDFVVSLVLGDIFDDAVWAGVAMSQFVVAAGTLFTVHVFVDYVRSRLGRVA
jgi:uncharacterized membrane protein YcaP (DUF421 family)